MQLMLTLLHYLKKRLDKFSADQNVMFDWTADITGTGDRRSIGVYSRKWLESLEEVVNKDTDKEAHVPASVFIIADCWHDFDVTYNKDNK